MSRSKATRVIVYGDESASITSSQRGANLDTVVFNVGLLLHRQPSLAVNILKLYEQARRVHADDPQAPEEDARAASEEWSDFVRGIDH